MLYYENMTATILIGAGDWRHLTHMTERACVYKIKEFYTEWFSVYPNITSKFRTIAIFKSPPFLNAWRYGIKMYGVEVAFNDITFVLNFIKIYQLVKKLLGGTDRQKDWWSHKPHFPF
jgi:hypothetical protein